MQGDGGDEDAITAPLFHEECPKESFNMSSYGGIDVSGLEVNTGKKRTLGRRLEKRRALIELRRIVINGVCILAFLGILLMMIETELFIFKYTGKSDNLSFVLKTCISVSTVLLLMGICVNYYVDLRIEALDAGVREWQSVISNSTVVCFVIEILVCSIHPFPGDLSITYNPVVGHSSQVSIDAVLCILMMARLYLIAKFTVAHSHLVTDTSINSIGALSKIKINTVFVFKAAMTRSPGRLLICVMLTTFLVNSWAMRTCECYYFGPADQNSYMEVMWLIATTFLTVGYGDKIPQSYCGRYISICTGVIGVLTSALMVAILARKLEQTRSERYVFNMVTRIQIENKRKTAAANVIKALIHLWQLRKYGVNDPKLRRKYSDNLKTAIRNLRTAKAQKAHIDEFNVGLLEISETVNDIGRSIDKIVKHQQKCPQHQTVLIENRLQNIEFTLDKIKTLLYLQAK